MELEIKFSNPNSKQQLQLFIHKYKLQFAQIKHRIYQQQQPLLQQINHRNQLAAEDEDEVYNPETQNLLSIHSEINTQEDNLVRARHIGHESLRVGNELK